MKNLDKYIERMNFWRVMEKKPLIDLKNIKDRQDIADNLSCDLSPENLHCDGEISRAEAMRKKRTLDTVFKELRSIDPNITLNY